MISERMTEIFERAKTRAQNFRRMDVELLDSIAEIDRDHVYRAYACTSLYVFCTELLELPPSVALNLINVMRKSKTVPELGAAVAEGLALTKARRIVPVITPENQAEWIHKAHTLPKLALEREVAAVNPVLVEVERMMPSARDRMKVEFFTSNDRFDDLTRAQDVVSTSIGRTANLDETIAHAVQLLLATRDPVAKADRAVTRINASVKSKVFARDRGQCQMKLGGGRRCGSRRYPHLHHKRARYHGGTDHPDNLTTLCGGCHRAWHRRYGDVPLYEGVGGPEG